MTHTGGLVVKGGYDNSVSVTLPVNLDTGTYYITPWTDPYAVVLQDTLAVNVNPDDPNNFNSDNYKARQMGVIAPLPDLVVTALAAPKQAQGGNNIMVSWSVKNIGIGIAQPTDWIDTVYLTDNPTDPLAKTAHTLTLGSVKPTAVLNPEDTYNANLNVELSPSAVGQYIVIYTDAPRTPAPPSSTSSRKWMKRTTSRRSPAV